MQFWLTIAKSLAEPTSSASAWMASAVMVSGASPVFCSTTGTTLSAAAVPAATDGNVAGVPSTVPTARPLMPRTLMKLSLALLGLPPSCSWW